MVWGAGGRGGQSVPAASQLDPISELWNEIQDIQIIKINSISKLGREKTEGVYNIVERRRGGLRE